MAPPIPLTTTTPIRIITILEKAEGGGGVGGVGIRKCGRDDTDEEVEADDGVDKVRLGMVETCLYVLESNPRHLDASQGLFTFSTMRMMESEWILIDMPKPRIETEIEMKPLAKNPTTEWERWTQVRVTWAIAYDGVPGGQKSFDVQDRERTKNN